LEVDRRRRGQLWRRCVCSRCSSAGNRKAKQIAPANNGLGALRRATLLNQAAARRVRSSASIAPFYASNLSPTSQLFNRIDNRGFRLLPINSKAGSIDVTYPACRCRFADCRVITQFQLSKHFWSRSRHLCSPFERPPKTRTIVGDYAVKLGLVSQIPGVGLIAEASGLLGADS
jgi:hypothetical protein